MSGVAAPAQRRTISTLLMRGGTSKGLFVAAGDLPAEGPERDDVVLSLLGGGDALQVDGLGGGNPSTSKLVAVSRGESDGDDLDYLYAAVSPGSHRVSYDGNCGNLTAAVAMYGLLTSLVEADDPDVATITLHNRNTGVRVRVRQPMTSGLPAVSGDYRMDGVARAGAEIVTSYLEPGGSVLGSTLPTGTARLELPAGPRGSAPISVVDVTSLYVFVQASYFGLRGTEPAAELNTDASLCGDIERLRRDVAVHLGLLDGAGDAPTPNQPRLALVAQSDDSTDAHFIVRAFPSGRFHHALSVTGAMCAAAAALLRGSVAAEIARGVAASAPIRVGHAKGVIDVSVDLDQDDHRILSTSVSRTARPLLQGRAFL